MATNIWFWVGFITFILVMLELDLGVFHRKEHEVKPREAGAWVAAWTTLALLFAAGLWRYEGGDSFRCVAAHHGALPEYADWVLNGVHDFGPPFFRRAGPWRTCQSLDIRETEPYRRGEPFWQKTADMEGVRTLLTVPLIREQRLVGSIGIYRREVRAFTDRQVELVETVQGQMDESGTE